jgi:hypothetical protein
VSFALDRQHASRDFRTHGGATTMELSAAKAPSTFIAWSFVSRGKMFAKAAFKIAPFFMVAI